MARLCTNRNAISVPSRMDATKACSAMRKVTPSAPSSVVQSLASFSAMSLGLGNRKIGTCPARQPISQITTMTTPTIKGAMIDMAASDCRNGRLIVASSALHLVQRHFSERRRQHAAMLGEARGIAEAFVARMRLFDRHHLEDMAGAGAHHHHAGRQEHGLVDRMGHEHGGELALPPQ